MSLPAPAAHGQNQIKESGGQPLVFGAVGELTFLQRQSGANTHVIAGNSTAGGVIRLTYFEILNQTTGKYTRYKCRDNGEGDSELYIDAEDLT